MLETIYQDFTTKLLPTIQQGLVISKDYFTDLFGRYVHYLIVKDSLFIIFEIILVIISIILFKTAMKINKENENKDYYEKSDLTFVFFIAGSILLLLFGISTFLIDIGNLIKDIYIPEVRVYEELKNFNLK